MKLKKLKKLWGERKKIWREYRTAFLIEIIFLCVAITATGLLIRMSQKGWEEKLQLMTKNVQNLVESNLDTRKAETETQLKKIGRASCKGKSVDLGGRRIIKKKNNIE